MSSRNYRSPASPSRRSASSPAFLSTVRCWLTAVLVTSNAAAISPAASSSRATSRRMARRRGSASARRISSVVSSSGRAIPPLIAALRSGPQPDGVAVRVREDREPAVVAGQVGGRHELLAAELLGAVQVAVQVVDPHVNLHAGLARALRRSDASADRVLLGPGVDERVTAHRRVGGNLPAEQVGVELLRARRVLADHLEKCHWLSHRGLPFLLRLS